MARISITQNTTCSRRPFLEVTLPQFGNKSRTILETCDQRLILVCNTAIMYYDFSVLSGHRGSEEQQQLFALGKSEKDGTDDISKHQFHPSYAIDIAPYPIDWADHFKFHTLGGFMLGIGQAVGVKLRWGGDWDGDWSNKDQKLHDLGHFEIIDG